MLIRKNAGPATLTVTSGFRDHTGANDTTDVVLSGSTSVDTISSLDALNVGGPLTMQASVAGAVIVFTRAA